MAVKNTGSNIAITFRFRFRFTSKKVLLQKVHVFQGSDPLFGSWPRLFSISAPAGLSTLMSGLKTSWWWTADNSQSGLAWLALFWPFMLEIGLWFLLLDLLQKVMQLNRGWNLQRFLQHPFFAARSLVGARETDNVPQNLQVPSIQFRWEQQQTPSDLFHLPAWTRTHYWSQARWWSTVSGSAGSPREHPLPPSPFRTSQVTEQRRTGMVAVWNQVWKSPVPSAVFSDV